MPTRVESAGETRYFGARSCSTAICPLPNISLEQLSSSTIPARPKKRHQRLPACRQHGVSAELCLGKEDIRTRVIFYSAMPAIRLYTLTIHSSDLQQCQDTAVCCLSAISWGMAASYWSSDWYARRDTRSLQDRLGDRRSKCPSVIVLVIWG